MHASHVILSSSFLFFFLLSLSSNRGLCLNSYSQQIVVSDGSSTLYLLDRNDLSTVLKRLSVHYINEHGSRILVDNLNELEYIPHPSSTPQEDRGEIFANFYESYCILRIHPTTGRIKGVLHADPKRFYRSQRPAGERGYPSVEAMNGIAFHTMTERLFVTGKLWKSIYQVTAVPHPVASGGGGGASTSSSSWKLDLSQHCPRIGMSVSEMSYWQRVLSDAAERGARLEGRTNVQTKHAQMHTPLPPHSAAAKIRAELKATEEEAKRLKSQQRQQHPHTGVPDPLTPLVHSHAELSAETRATLEDGEEASTVQGHDSRHFDLSRYVQLEMDAMRREAIQEWKHQTHDTKETTTIAHAMMSGDID